MAKTATRFRAKTWIFWAQAIFCGLFCAFGLIMGPLLYTFGAKDPKHREAGLWITGITLVLFVPGLAKAVFNILARRKPLVQLYREGITVRLVGRSTLDGVPGVPGLLRFAWGVLSGQSFRSHALYSYWKELRGARVEGLPAMRILILDGTFRGLDDDEIVGDQLVFPQVEFRKPLQDLARVIHSHTTNPEKRTALPSWSESQ
jgi:hypothetical protein